MAILNVPSSEHLYMELLLFCVVNQLGLGDMKTAEGAGVRALTGVRERRKRHLSAVLDRYSPLRLLKLINVYD